MNLARARFTRMVSLAIRSWKYSVSNLGRQIVAGFAQGQFGILQILLCRGFLQF